MVVLVTLRWKISYRSSSQHSAFHDSERFTRLTAEFALKCPKCHATLASDLRCEVCLTKYPSVEGVPILIDHDLSVFTLEDVQAMSSDPTGRALKRLKQLVPKLSSNMATDRVYGQLRDKLLLQSRPVVLSIGGGDGGIGIDHLRHSRIHIINTDVRIGPGVDYGVDAHSLPFPDGTFDLVIAQAVLEHVADPDQCVREIHRVLRPDGIVFAETPFMQQVHLGRYDFTRFTHLGHRRLFRNFRELESGQVASAATALAWALTNFFTSFATSRRTHQIIYLGGRLLFGWIKYLDPLVARRAGSWDAASAFYFVGSRSETTLSDAEILRGYRGLR
jgi:SAM-dependent methyltransferase